MAIANLCREKPFPDFALVSPSIPVLARFLSVPDVGILSDACLALSCLTDGSDDGIEMVLKEESIVSQLVELLDHESPKVQTFAGRTIGNIVTGTEAHTQVVLDCPMALPLLKKLLHGPKLAMRKEGCWAISNIAAGSQEQIQMMIDAGVIPLVVAIILSNNGEFEEALKKEALYVLGNVFSYGSVDQIVYLVEQNVIPGFLSHLDNDDSEAVFSCLKGIWRMLKVGRDSIVGEENPFAEKMVESEDFYKFEDLQDHQNARINRKVRVLLDEYFEENEE